MKMLVTIDELLINVNVLPITRPIINQVILSSSSVASKYKDATHSRSNAKFCSKICIVV